MARSTGNNTAMAVLIVMIWFFVASQHTAIGRETTEQIVSTEVTPSDSQMKETVNDTTSSPVSRITEATDSSPQITTTRTPPIKKATATTKDGSSGSKKDATSVETTLPTESTSGTKTVPTSNDATDRTTSTTAEKPSTEPTTAAPTSAGVAFTERRTTLEKVGVKASAAGTGQEGATPTEASVTKLHHKNTDTEARNAFTASRSTDLPITRSNVSLTQTTSNGATQKSSTLPTMTEDNVAPTSEIRDLTTPSTRTTAKSVVTSQPTEAQLDVSKTEPVSSQIFTEQPTVFPTTAEENVSPTSGIREDLTTQSAQSTTEVQVTYQSGRSSTSELGVTTVGSGATTDQSAPTSSASNTTNHIKSTTESRVTEEISTRTDGTTSPPHSTMGQTTGTSQPLSGTESSASTTSTEGKGTEKENMNTMPTFTTLPEGTQSLDETATEKPATITNPTRETTQVITEAITGTVTPLPTQTTAQNVTEDPSQTTPQPQTTLRVTEAIIASTESIQTTTEQPATTAALETTENVTTSPKAPITSPKVTTRHRVPEIESFNATAKPVNTINSEPSIASTVSGSQAPAPSSSSVTTKSAPVTESTNMTATAAPATSEPETDSATKSSSITTKRIPSTTEQAYTIKTTPTVTVTTGTRAPCKAHDFKCANTFCVPLFYRCDGEDDCGDKSDEHACGRVPESPCPVGYFHCGNSDDGEISCVKKIARCDGIQDCYNNKDEHGCGAPNVAVSPSDDITNVLIGRDYQCTCTANGIYPSTFLWRRDGEPLSNDSQRVTIETTVRQSVLSIKNVTKGHSGRYECVATNVKGSTTSDPNCRLRVRAPGDACKPPLFNEFAASESNCHTCFCMGRTDQCSSSTLYRNKIKTDFTKEANTHGFSLIQASGAVVQRSLYGVVEDSKELAAHNMSGDVVYYWRLPKLYLGRKFISYGGNLHYTIKFSEQSLNNIGARRVRREVGSEEASEVASRNLPKGAVEGEREAEEGEERKDERGRQGGTMAPTTTAQVLTGTEPIPTSVGKEEEERAESPTALPTPPTPPTPPHSSHGPTPEAISTEEPLTTTARSVNTKGTASPSTEGPATRLVTLNGAEKRTTERGDNTPSPPTTAEGSPTTGKVMEVAVTTEPVLTLPQQTEATASDPTASGYTTTPHVTTSSEEKSDGKTTEKTTAAASAQTNKVVTATKSRPSTGPTSFTPSSADERTPGIPVTEFYSTRYSTAVPVTEEVEPSEMPILFETLATTSAPTRAHVSSPSAEKGSDTTSSPSTAQTVILATSTAEPSVVSGSVTTKDTQSLRTTTIPTTATDSVTESPVTGKETEADPTTSTESLTGARTEETDDKTTPSAPPTSAPTTHASTIAMLNATEMSTIKRSTTVGPHVRKTQSANLAAGQGFTYTTEQAAVTQKPTKTAVPKVDRHNDTTLPITKRRPGTPTLWQTITSNGRRRANGTTAHPRPTSGHVSTAKPSGERETVEGTTTKVTTQSSEYENVTTLPPSSDVVKTTELDSSETTLAATAQVTLTETAPTTSAKSTTDVITHCIDKNRTYVIGKIFPTADCAQRCLCNTEGRIACIGLCPSLARCSPNQDKKERMVLMKGTECLCKNVTCYDRGPTAKPITVPTREPIDQSLGDVVLVGGQGVILTYNHPVDPEPGRYNDMRVPILESAWYTPNKRRASRLEIMKLLFGIDSILIRATYTRSVQLENFSIKDVALDVAGYENKELGRAVHVEQCQCPSQYQGLSCESCAPGHYLERTGSPFTDVCLQCRCHGHSNQCDADSGICNNCQHNTEGPQCGTCKAGYYGDATKGTPADCRQCPCPLTQAPNSFSPTCFLAGDGKPTCDACPKEYEGRNCERCSKNYTGNPLKLGEKCLIKGPDFCDLRGSFSDKPDNKTRFCKCKPYATGWNCHQCRRGFYGLGLSHRGGCVRCFCNGVSDDCASSNWNITQDGIRFLVGARQGVVITDESGTLSFINLLYNPRTRELVFQGFDNAAVKKRPLYWKLPKKFLGNKLTSYGGRLMFIVSYIAHRGGDPIDSPTVILKGNGAIIQYTSSEQYTGHMKRFRVPFNETDWHRMGTGHLVSRDELMMILASVEYILIKAVYTTTMVRTSLRDVYIDMAMNRFTYQKRAVRVEQCKCPSGYSGLSCESCNPGYYRVREGPFLGKCVRCNCNGHASSCDPNNGKCNTCLHNTHGKHCEKCLPGYYGDPTVGTEDDCRPCACPMASPPNKFSATCFLDKDGRQTCDDCKIGYQGRNCESCRKPFVGNPLVIGDFCKWEGDCGCDPRGSVNNSCDPFTLQCFCKEAESRRISFDLQGIQDMSQLSFGDLTTKSNIISRANRMALQFCKSW